MKTSLNKRLSGSALALALTTSLLVPSVGVLADEGHQEHKKKSMEHMHMKDDHHGKEGMKNMHMKMKAKMRACVSEKLSGDSDANAGELKEKMLGHMEACMDDMMKKRMAKMKDGKHKKSEHKKEEKQKH